MARDTVSCFEPRWKNQEACCDSCLSVALQSMAVAFVEACKQCCISSELDWTDDDTLWNDSKENGVLAVGVKKVKALTVRMDTLQTMEMERVTLIGKGRISHVLYTNCMKLTANYFS